MEHHSRSRRILYIQYTNPCGYPPLLHSSEILAGRGWEVLFLGTQAVGFETLYPPHRPGVHFQYFLHGASGWRHKLQYLWFCLWCAFWTWRWRPAWIYASDLFSCIPALLVQTLFGTRLVYHEHDAPMEDEGSTGVFRLFHWARRKTARTAELCIIPNENRAKHFRKQTGTSREVRVVWNTPMRNEIGPQRHRPEGRLKLLYHGSIVPARLPVELIQALKKVGYPVVLRIVGYETVGSQGYTAQLQRAAEELGIPDSLEFVGFLQQREEVIEHCQTCDVGLAVVPQKSLDPNLVDLFGASNKIFDYMACGLALLVSPLLAWPELPKYGLTCDPMEAGSIASALRYFCEHPEEMRAMGERGRQRILDEWNYETNFGPALELIES
jgi:glycosyltransferase involved in cell wall biosynthesis